MVEASSIPVPVCCVDSAITLDRADMEAPIAQLVYWKMVKQQAGPSAGSDSFSLAWPGGSRGYTGFIPFPPPKIDSLTPRPFP